MSTENEPNIGHWYRRLDKGQLFQVVAVDEDEATVEIQHFDGDVEELDLDAWYETDLEPIEAPEDWTGPLDDVVRDDLGYTETDMEADDWIAPLDELQEEEIEETEE